MTSAAITDIVFAVLLIISCINGYIRGLVIMIARIASFVISYFLAVFIAKSLKTVVASTIIMPVIEASMKDKTVSMLAKTATKALSENIAYFVIFMLVIVIIQIVFGIIMNLLKLVDKIPVVGKINKLGGAAAGFLCTFLIIFCIVNLTFTYLPYKTLKSAGYSRKHVRETYILSAIVPDSYTNVNK